VDEVLGVPRTATQKEIKSAFRKLARQYHPDVTGSDPEATRKFKEINEGSCRGGGSPPPSGSHAHANMRQ